MLPVQYEKKSNTNIRNPDIKEFSDAYWKVLNFFFAFPQIDIGLNDLSKATKISKTTTKRVVIHLISEEFLYKKEIGKLWRITCNQRHPFNLTRKVPLNLMKIYESGIIETIHEIIPNSICVILFGSYRKGDDNEYSDIDIAVEIVGNNEPKILELGIIKEINHRQDIKVNVYLFSRNKIDLNLFANIANGIILEGFFEASP